MSVYDLDWAEGRAEANDLYLGMDWPDPPEGDEDEPEDDDEVEGS